MQRTTASKSFPGRNESERVALRAGLLYLSIAALWILLSDRLVGALIADPEAIIRVQMYKGWAFVTVTAVFLFAGIRRQLSRWEKELAGRRKAEEALRASEKRFAGIISSAMDAIVSVDEGQRIVLFNPAAEEMFGYKPPEVIGGSLDLLIPERFRAAHKQHIDDFGHSNQTRRKMIEHHPIYGRRADGTEFLIEASISQITVAGRKIFTATLRDITERKRAEEALQQSEKRYRSLFENMLEGYAYCEMLFERGEPQDFVYLDVNRAFESLTGLKNVVGKKVTEVIPGIRESNPELFEIYGRVALSGAPERFETCIESLGIWFAVSVYSPAQGYFVAVFDNITERKRSEAQLRKLSRAVEQSSASIVITNTRGEIEYVNPKFTRVTGYTLDEVGGKNPRLLKSGETPAEDYRSLWETIRAGKEWQGEFHNNKKNGELYWELASILPIVDEAGRITHFLAVKEDITERKAAEEKIKASLREKEVLLKEIHHRVKNNLQVISSLLKLQSKYTKDKRIVELFDESRQRVKAMALIHEELYKSADLARIKFASYVQSIADHLMRSYGARSNAIALKVDIEELQLDVDRAVPCGLIINELVTNSLKYAFPPELAAQRERGENKITIEMRLQDGAQVAMKISDNGIGLPEGLDFRSSESLGLQLVNTLTEQLHGAISCNQIVGTEFEISFIAGNGGIHKCGSP